MDVLLEKLNIAQIEAIKSIEGYVQVIAGLDLVKHER